MRNLKRVLALSLAVIMLVGMMVIGASAVDFTDSDEIVNGKAVNVLYALNVVSGKEDGSYFDPNGNVTRAEMAKMITVALNGGNAPALGTGESFADCAGHWAEKFIRYCASLEIVAGRGNGNFDPNANVTGTEAAKMMLVAMKYKPDVHKLEGGDWAKNTDTAANEAGLYEDLLNIDPSAPISRDNAAQLIYNGIFAPTMKLSWGQNMETGVVTQNWTLTGDSIFEEKYAGYVTEGVLVDYTWNADEAEWDYTFWLYDDENGDPVYAILPSAENYTNLLFMNTEVMWTIKSNGDEKVYGVYAEDSKVLATGVYGDISYGSNDALVAAKKVKFAGVEYKLEGAAKLGFVAKDNDDVSSPKAYWPVSMIDLDGNSKADYFVIWPVYVGQVTYAGKNIQTDMNASINGDTLNSVVAKDVEAYEGIAKDDFVAVIENDYEKLSFVKLNKVSGKITDTKSNDSNTAYTNVALDGTYYGNVDVPTTVTLGSTIDAYVVNGYIADYEIAATAIDASKYAVVTAVESEYANSGNKDGLNAYWQAKLLFADGTTKVVDIADESVAAGLYVKGTFVTFKVNAKGAYELTAAGQDTTKNSSTYCGFEMAYENGTFTKKTGTVDGYALADDAIVFVKKLKANGSVDSFKVISGAEYKIQGATTVSTDDVFANVYGDKNEKTGYTTVTMGYVASKLPNASDWAYGYITSKLEATQDKDKNTVYKVTFWNGTSNVTVTTKDAITAESALADLYAAGNGAKGKVFMYKLGDGLMIDFAEIAANTYKTAVQAYDGKNITFMDDVHASQTVSKFVIDEKTVVIYVDAENMVGEEGGMIRLATETETAGTYYTNVWAYDSGAANGDGDYTVEVIVVDTQNGVWQ